MRSDAGKNFGICLIPEGLIEFIPENNVLFDFLNNKILPAMKEVTVDAVDALLPEDMKATFRSIPLGIRT